MGLGGHDLGREGSTGVEGRGSYLMVSDDKFDSVEIRAARTIGEADYFWKYHLKNVPAARIDLPPSGFLPKVRRIMDAVLLKGGLR